MKDKYTLYIIGLILFATGCTKPVTYPQVPVADLVETVYRFSSLTSAQRDSILIADSAQINALLRVVGDSTLMQWSRSRVVSVFSPDIQRVFPTVEPLEHYLGYALARASENGLLFPSRKYAAVACGRPESVLFVDSVMLIALNHFLGADYPGYAGMPDYLKQLKTSEQLPYALAEALTGISYPFASRNGTTLLNRMLYEGALMRAKMLLVQNADPAAALGYTHGTYSELLKQESEIWESLVRSQLLYDTSATTIERVCSPAPFVRVGTSEWPGRVGRFIGWRIVEAYARKNPEAATLPYLLSDDFYNSDSILLLSGY